MSSEPRKTRTRRKSRKAPEGPRVLHLDAFSGAAGNMFMGALLDLGLPRKTLLEGLAPLELDFKLVIKKVQRNGFAARYVDVRVPGAAKPRSSVARNKRGGSGAKRGAAPKMASGHHAQHDGGHDHDHGHAGHRHDPASAGHGHGGVHLHGDLPGDGHGHAGAHGRSYAEIRDLISGARLIPRVQERALEIFEALGRAEAKVHGALLEDVHFHEVGAVDAIVDVTAAAVGLDALEIEYVTCSPVGVGHGTIDSAHGLLPLPAPATLELLTGIPTVPAHVEWETLTPTGAAILKTVVDEFCELPAMTIEAIGLGAGNDRSGGLPNVLRAMLGRRSGMQHDRVVCLETNLDDLVPEHFDYVMERLFEEGALDVSLQPLQMKKNRPGFLVRVICKPMQRDVLARILFAESTAIGVRATEWDRLVLERENVRVRTEWGTIRVKKIRTPDGQSEFTPEYDDCKRAARKSGLALREVVRRVAEQARAEQGE